MAKRKLEPKTGRCADCGVPIKKRSTRCRVCECKSRTEPIAARFWRYVDKDGPIMFHMDSPCWEWTAYSLPNSYGILNRKTGSNLVHRISWELHHKQSIPTGLDVLHKCDNPKCVNPDHLFLGTHSDNMRDMTDKGRNVTHPGETNNKAKLTAQQVEQIRTRYNSTNVSQPQLAREYGVSQSAIWYIIHKRNWKHI